MKVIGQVFSSGEGDWSYKFTWIKVTGQVKFTWMKGLLVTGQVIRRMKITLLVP